ncbi:MAG: HpsJ family protein [Xenococcaceae cyanobacterium]
MILSKLSSKKHKSRRQNSRNQRIIQVAIEKLEKTSKMLPTVGYFILGLTFLDYIFLLIPPHFLNPTWEINVIGHLTENVWAPLLGFSLVFIRRENSFKTSELRLLSWLSRFIILIAIIYFLAAPLLISNTIKIQQKNFSELKSKLEIQKSQVEQFKQKLSQVPEEQLANYLRQQQAQAPSVTENDDSGTPLEQAYSKIDEEEIKSAEQIKKAYTRQKLSLMKRSLKWFIGTIFSGVIFLLFWRHTEWARKTLTN